jgi:hypothetical protein
VGVLQVRGDVVLELLVPEGISNENYWNLCNKRYRVKILDRLRRMESGGIAGLPNIKGTGPAQSVYDRIVEYRRENPKATWKAMFEVVPNHYASFQSMRQSLKMIEAGRIREGWLETNLLYKSLFWMTEKMADETLNK